MKKTLITLALTMVSAGASAQMDNSNMNHDNMDHGKMDHGSMSMDNMNMGDMPMDHSKMDHSNMQGMVGMSAVGMPANGAKPDKVVHVILSDDMKITFKKDVKIEPNDVVQFVVMNTGKIDHEFTIGSAAEQLEHREMMKNMSGNHMHDSGNAVTVEPGKAKQILWHFHGDNNVEFACNIPGHAEAGMVKKVKL
ncbi:copper-resistant cuproprotein CopI [Vibrio parahaemolyticus]|uniref:copper-resistant cuproprotein CopI n=1 Tax=Vibrio parahaemolyticus TaxID=670 RepID=UPI0007A01606|nr:cupredoxin family protein [Vibrio parahaemolyticus]EGQ7676769.1 copper-binding protein [Vibrio parahaemolyticus]EGQ7679183.1 copper-binding protein [Vibrio parahaemolyticus]EGQ9220119.1 copper-binding protein [Vibrio parahaemolyticus]EGQ9222043.1 copper-binding protein [Vibrio parahaemolyticus]ELA7275342.1 copper-binding protein [Vibrio parahaemolyticus]